MKRAVYGMGAALINHWDLIQEWFGPEYGIDNAPEKWGKADRYTGLPCIPFEEAKRMEGLEVLVTIGDPYAAGEVSAQLKEAGIAHTLLTDALGGWCAGMELPERLHAMAGDGKKILLFNTPEHDNTGDHLISLSALSYLERRFGDYRIHEVTDIEYLRFHEKIRKHVGAEDIVLVTGGGFLGSLWLYNGERNVRDIIREYPENRIVILPQTVYFEKNERGKREYRESLKTYRMHRRLTVCAREEGTMRLLSSMLEGRDGAAELLPDMALLYRGSCRAGRRDTGKTLVCLRGDKERLLPQGGRERILRLLSEHGLEAEEISMHSGDFGGRESRKRQVEEKLGKIAGAGLVVTDTLHCKISAALAGTACIAFDNLSGKVRGVYRWIEGLPYVRLCGDMEGLGALIGEMKGAFGVYALRGREAYERKLEGIIRRERGTWKDDTRQDL